MLKIFKCFKCDSSFDRPSQLDYHYRSKHLGERSHVCQICGKGFFRKADLRMHLNIHLGTNFHICEVCGRKFNHISNLIRHCRIHTGIKPYVCQICDKRFTQISSLAKHKQIHTPKDFIQQYCNPSLINNKSKVKDCTLNKNETINDDIQNKNHETFCIEQKCFSQNTARVSDIQKNEIIVEKHNTDIGNKACLSLRTVVHAVSKQDHFAEIEERLKSINLPMNKTVVSNSPRDRACNEQIQSKDIAYQFSKNNCTFLSQDREPNTESNIHNDENILRLNCSDTYAIQETYKEITTNDVKNSSNVETNLQICNFNEVLTNKKFLSKHICKEIISENRKSNKLLNDDNQLYLEFSDSGMLKLNESRYCHNTDFINVNVNHTEKSQNSESIAANDTLYTSVANDDQNNLLQRNEEILNNLNNAVLNNEEPILRLVQTETGEQFYEYVINNLVEKMQNVSCGKNFENTTEETANAFEDNEKTTLNLRESNKKNDHIEHQQSLEALIINNEFNYTQLESHGGEKNFSVLCHGEHFQQNSQQAYNFENLELLESHTDFDKYVETGFEAFERLNYEKFEKFLELEVADIGVEFSTYKEPSMIRLIQNEGEQLLELLQDSQIIEQENQNFIQTNNLNKDCSNVLQDSNKIIDCSKSKSDFFTYVENNMPLEENINCNQAMENNDRCVDSGIEHLYRDIITNESISNENCGGTSEESKKLKITLKKFHCSVCNKTFSTAYNYKQHIGIHFTDQQKFHCKDCGLSFAWKSTLNKHIVNNHSLDGPQKFVCEICPKVYSTLSQVNEHVKRDHLKQRDHVCLTCGKTFFKRFDLKIHSRTHTNERPYVCNICSKSFHHQSHFIRHKRIHTGIKPYACVYCPKRFTQMSSLKIHQQKHEVCMDFTDYQIDEDDSIALATL
ncbi:zinc finger protein 91-like isoform X1 [Cataglyphis hispanica]|uniref:zinc finger protein 91-like isoform X1 n=1 Tax=Cataglyphis hispanica TaxID=1086592 RepID=UPI00217F2555|nr:zinc finger protein 91-like isoform X1 [Cataglyphis hispanica]